MGRWLALALLLLSESLFALSQLCVGGGWWDIGRKSATALAQVEYKFDLYWFDYIRPEAALIVPDLRSVFLGAGLALEIYFNDHWVFSPNFMPGYYYQGEGKNLGYPLEFRSALEMAYEWCSGVRLGAQFYHISNASLGTHNPGANSLTLFAGFPLPRNFP